jgi:hypothetical protein
LSHSDNTDVEYLTILAATSAEAMEQFSKRGLAAEGYSIAGRVGRHRVAVVTDGRSTEMLGDAMVAATFRRATRT